MKKQGKPGVLYVHVDQGLLTWLDERAEEERKKSPGRRITRSDIVRELLLAAAK
jgi:hypothetical protein